MTSLWGIHRKLNTTTMMRQNSLNWLSWTSETVLSWKAFLAYKNNSKISWTTPFNGGFIQKKVELRGKKPHEIMGVNQIPSSSKGRVGGTIQIPILKSLRVPIKKRVLCRGGDTIKLNFSYPQGSPRRLRLKGTCKVAGESKASVFKLNDRSGANITRTAPPQGRNLNLSIPCDDFTLTVFQLN